LIAERWAAKVGCNSAVEIPPLVEKPSFEPRLESLRGLAALTVATHHSLAVFVGGAYSDHPAALATLGHWLLDKMSSPDMAVLFFFVLSGYVLGQSVERDPSYLRYIIRRILRIFPAFVVSVLFAYACLTLIRIEPAPDGLTSFFTTIPWPMPTPQKLEENLALHGAWVNGPTWSIHWEIVGSVLLPVLVYLHRSIGSVLQIPLFIAASAFISFAKTRAYMLPLTEYFYAGFFLPPLIARYLPQHWLARTTAFVLGYWIMLRVSPTDKTLFSTIGPASVSGSLMIGAVISSKDFMSWLRGPIFRFLGRVSYSLYLFHWPILYVVTIAAVSWGLPQGVLGNWIACLSSVPLVLVVSAFTYRWLEVPFMNLGKRMARPPALVTIVRPSPGLDLPSPGSEGLPLQEQQLRRSSSAN